MGKAENFLQVSKIEFSRKTIDKEKVFEPHFGHISDVIPAAIKIAKKQDENINLSFNDTVVTISPGSNYDEVEKNWLRIHKFQQRK